MLKAITKDATRTCVTLYDPAIDLDAMSPEEIVAYEEAWRSGGDWRSLLKIKDGEQVTIFSIGVLSSEEMNTIIDETKRADGAVRSDERYWRLFVAGVRDIKPWQGEIQRDQNGQIKRSWLCETFIGPLRRAAQGVGVCVFAYNTITEAETKNLSGRSKRKSATAARPAQSATSDSASGEAASDQG